MFDRIKRAMCLHWFDAPTIHESDGYVGAIVCCQQKHFTFKVETRVCSRCGLSDSRRLGEPVFEGWD